MILERQNDSSDDGWSDDHFSDVASSEDESQKYIQLNQVKYPEKLSTSPALPPRTHISRPPVPPIRKKNSLCSPRPKDYSSPESHRRQFYKDHEKVSETLTQAMLKLKPTAICKENDEDYEFPINTNRKFSKDHNKIPENVSHKITKLKPATNYCSEEDGDYVCPVNKPSWLQSKASLTSPVTHREMSARKKLPIPKLFNNSNDAESALQQELEAFEWFHGKSNREVIKEQLLQHEKNGMYAVRKSNQKSNFHSYSLTFYHKGHIYNFPIRTRVIDKKFALGYEKQDEPAFSSLEKLVAYFTDYKIKLANNELAILTQPLPKFS